MATIDPSIALSVKPIQIQDPLNRMAAMMQIEGGQQSQQLNALKMQEYERGLGEENKLRQLLSSGVDINSPETVRQMYGISPTKGLEFQTKQQTIQTQKLETQKKIQDLTSQMKRDLSRSPTNANLNAHFEDFVSSGLFNTQQIAAAKATRDQLLAMPSLPDRQAFLASQGATASDLKPTIKETDIGGSIIPRVYDAYSGTQISQGTPTVKTPTPGEAMTNTIARERLKLEQDKAFREQTTGTIPAGYRLNKDTNELEAIPGGPTTVALPPKEKQKREATYPKATSAIKAFENTSDDLIKDLAELRNHPGLSSITGIAAGRLPGVTKEGRAAQALYDKIVARGGFQALTDLRAAGGTLGAVSNQEGTQLKDSYAAINRTQDASDVRKALDQALANTQRSKERVREEYDTTYEYRNTVPRSSAAPAGAKPSLNDIFNPQPQ